MKFTNQNLAFEIDLQWFAKHGPGGEKTEPATAKKLRDAREEGKVARSKELTAAFDLIVLFLVLKIFVSFVAERLIGSFAYTYSLIPDFVEMNAKDVSGQAVSTVIANALLQILITCLPFFAFGLVITLVISIYQVGWKISTKPMVPKLDRFNPINGFKRIFSSDSVHPFSPP